MKRKQLLTLILCTLSIAVCAQEDTSAMSGWEVPPVKKEASNGKKKKKQKEIPPFVRDVNAPQPKWRRPQVEEEKKDPEKHTTTVKYYKSMEDFKAGRSDNLVDIEFEEHSRSRRLWLGGNDFKFKSGNEEMDDILKKEALIIEMDDSLYINCRLVRTADGKFAKGYAHGYRYDGDKICFVNEDINDAKSFNKKANTFGYMFGILGAIPSTIQLKDFLNNTVCYILDDDSGYVYTVEDSHLINILSESDRGDIKSWLSTLTIEQRQSAYVVLRVMEELDLLRAN